MLTEWAVRSSAAPIASATPMKRRLNNSSVTGSGRRVAGVTAGLGAATARRTRRIRPSASGQARPAGRDGDLGVAADDQRGPARGGLQAIGRDHRRVVLLAGGGACMWPAV